MITVGGTSRPQVYRRRERMGAASVDVGHMPGKPMGHDFGPLYHCLWVT